MSQAIGRGSPWQSGEVALELSKSYAQSVLVCVVFPPTISVLSYGWRVAKVRGGSKKPENYQ